MKKSMYEKDIFRVMEGNFHMNKKAREENLSTSGYFYKWTSTKTLSNGIVVTVSETRRMLYQMAKEGKVEMVRRSGTLLWAPATPFIGFKQHQFKDYFESDLTPLQ